MLFVSYQAVSKGGKACMGNSFFDVPSPTTIAEVRWIESRMEETLHQTVVVINWKVL